MDANWLTGNLPDGAGSTCQVHFQVVANCFGSNTRCPNAFVERASSRLCFVFAMPALVPLVIILCYMDSKKRNCPFVPQPVQMGNSFFVPIFSLGDVLVGSSYFSWVNRHRHYHLTCTKYKCWLTMVPLPM